MRVIAEILTVSNNFEYNLITNMYETRMRIDTIDLFHLSHIVL